MKYLVECSSKWIEGGRGARVTRLHQNQIKMAEGEMKEKGHGMVKKIWGFEAKVCELDWE